MTTGKLNVRLKELRQNVDNIIAIVSNDIEISEDDDFELDYHLERIDRAMCMVKRITENYVSKVRPTKRPHRSDDKQPVAAAFTSKHTMNSKEGLPDTSSESEDMSREKVDGEAVHFDKTLQIQSDSDVTEDSGDEHIMDADDKEKQVRH